MNAQWKNWKWVVGGLIAVSALTGCIAQNNPSGEEDGQVEDQGETAYITEEIASMGDVLMASALLKAGADSARGGEKVVDPLHLMASCTCFVRKAEFTGVNGFERDRMDTVVLIDSSGKRMDRLHPGKAAEIRHNRHVVKSRNGVAADFHMNTIMTPKQEGAAVYGVWNGTISGSFKGAGITAGEIKDVERQFVPGRFGLPLAGSIRLVFGRFELDIVFEGDGKGTASLTNTRSGKERNKDFDLSGTADDNAIMPRDTIVVDGKPRTFLVYAPTGAAPSQGLPVVLMIHGTGQNGQIFYESSYWKEKAEAEKFLAVFPDALPYCIMGKSGPYPHSEKWNSGPDVIPCAGVTMEDDMKFIRALIDTIKSRHTVDAKRLYASGFSNGGEMTRRLWREAGDLFAAVASSAAFGYDTTAPTELIPYFLTLGNLDDLVSEGTGIPVPMPMDSTLFQNQGMAAARDLILRQMGLTGTAPVTETADKTTTFHYSSPAVPGLEFNWMNVEGLFHQYANGTNHRVRYADIFWDFFKQYSK
jgi:poly(3-hydroxybutyrate) depolymerase